MTTTITVEAKVLGQRRPLFADWVLALPPEWDDALEYVSLRDLIARVVRQEVTAFQERQEQRRLLRVLTPSEIGESAIKGRVAMGGSDLEQMPDPQTAVETALQAFEDGIYLVFVDDEQRMTLDDPIQIGPSTRVTFVRLVALAGG